MKTTLGCTFGATLAMGFIFTMDDVIYGNLRKNVVIPFQMTQISGRSNLLDASLKAAQGT